MSVGTKQGTQRGMGERYLSDRVALLLYVERCHRFGTKHLDEYAEQLRPCVIYAKSAYSSGARARVVPRVKGAAKGNVSLKRLHSLQSRLVPSEWWPRRQWTRGGSVNKR